MKPVNPIAKIKVMSKARECWGQVDYDYIDKLSAAEQEWLASFTESHYQGKGTNRGKRRNDAFTLKQSDLNIENHVTIEYDLDEAIDEIGIINRTDDDKDDI